MSLTYSIDHTSTTVEDVSVEVAAKSEMTFQKTFVDSSTGETVSQYVLASGDNAYQALVEFRSTILNRKSGQIRRIVIGLSTWATKSDSVSGIDTKAPVKATLAYEFPANMTIEVADFDDLHGNLFSFAYPSVTTKVRSTAWLQSLLYGATKVA